MIRVVSLLAAKTAMARVASSPAASPSIVRQLLTASSSTSSSVISSLSSVPFSSSSSPSTCGYHVEVSNIAKQDITQVIITGKGVPGLLASICVTLTIKGGDIKELHAADNILKEDSRHPHLTQDEIRDVFYVVQQQTGTSFPDSDLYDLGQAILSAITISPMKIVTVVKSELEKQQQLLYMQEQQLQQEQKNGGGSDGGGGLNGSSIGSGDGSATTTTASDVGGTGGPKNSATTATVAGKVTVIPKSKFPSL